MGSVGPTSIRRIILCARIIPRRELASFRLCCCYSWPDSRALALKGQTQSILLDTLGEEELAALGDPSFESISRHFPAMRFSREVIGVKDDPKECVVQPDGTLQLDRMELEEEYSGLPHEKRAYAFFEIAIAPVPGYVLWHRFGSGENLCAKRLLEDYPC